MPPPCFPAVNDNVHLKSMGSGPGRRGSFSCATRDALDRYLALCNRRIPHSSLDGRAPGRAYQTSATNPGGDEIGPEIHLENGSKLFE